MILFLDNHIVNMATRVSDGCSSDTRPAPVDAGYLAYRAVPLRY